MFGRYERLGRIGAGAMGEVFAAHDPELGRKVALKLLAPRRGSSPASRLRLQREARALARLGHPNVVTVHDVGVHDDQLFIAMEYI
ncbi:MAG: protein kinase, partial [Myxococcales bacterium]|nr:protein kinase [Myxococcales bacterium]